MKNKKIEIDVDNIDRLLFLGALCALFVGMIVLTNGKNFGALQDLWMLVLLTYIFSTWSGFFFYACLFYYFYMAMAGVLGLAFSWYWSLFFCVLGAFFWIVFTLYKSWRIDEPPEGRLPKIG